MSIKYTVKNGDTLSAIAKKYNITVSAIHNANKQLIKDVNKISVGWCLTIPKTTNINKGNYEQIGRQLTVVLNDIKNLKSYKELTALL